MSCDELNALVSRLQQAMRAAGVVAGDRVAAMLPNLPEAVAAMLAASSLGAIFSSCSPDFGERGVLDRFGQIEPKLLFACDGYWYNGKTVDVAAKLKAIAAALPSAETVVIVPYLGRRGNGGGRDPARQDARRFHRRLRAGAADLRAAALRSSALHPLLLRHDRRAEMHRPRRRRHAAAASEGAPAALLAAAPATACSTSPRSAG